MQKEQSEDTARIQLAEHIRHLTDVARPLLRAPWPWAAVTLSAAALSIVRFSHDQSGSTVHAEVTVVTAVLIALTWLPGLVRAIFVVGGTLKLPGGEASAPGLLGEFERRVAVISAGLAQREAEAPDSAARLPIREARQLIETEAGRVVGNPTQSEQRLKAIANEYEQLRHSMASGGLRTVRFEQLMAEARILGGALHASPADLATRFARGTDGDRVVALSLMTHAEPDLAFVPVALSAIQNARSPFEQFLALRLSESLIPTMKPQLRQELLNTIHSRRKDGPFDPNGPIVITTDDRSRWLLAQRLLELLGGSSV